MKRIISLVMILGLMLTLCSCGNKERILYNVDLDKYIELGDYKNIKIDTESDDFKENYDSIISEHVENNDLYVKKTEGKVADGDVANIDYEGKKDGVAFEGGTDKGYDLEIGSGSFIDGFEEGLIGVEIGDTVDLNLTFPEDYGNEELNGAAVVFTVKVNYVKTDEAIKAEEYYKDLGFKSVEDYYTDVKQTAIEWTLLDTVVKGAKIKNYPKEDLKFLKESSYKTIETNLQNSYGVDLDTYLQYSQQTKEDFEETLISQEIKPMMESQMAIYAIFDKEKLSFQQKEIEDKINEIVEQIGNNQVTEKEVKDYYGEYYFENLVINEKVTEHLLKKIKIS